MATLKDREEKRKSIVSSIIQNNTPIDEQKSVPQEDNVPKDIIIGRKDKVETRSKRVNLLIKPTTYSLAQKKCNKMGISLNECVNQFLDGWIDI